MCVKYYMLRTISASDKCVHFAVVSVADFQHYRTRNMTQAFKRLSMFAFCSPIIGQTRTCDHLLVLMNETPISYCHYGTKIVTVDRLWPKPRAIRMELFSFCF